MIHTAQQMPHTFFWIGVSSHSRNKSKRHNTLFDFCSQYFSLGKAQNDDIPNVSKIEKKTEENSVAFRCL